MIKQLEIKNFQSHKLSKFEFVPGVNVIMGPSHSGKSVIIRNIKWLVSNQPKGDSFKSHFIKKKEAVISSLTKFNGCNILRFRNKSTNQYIHNASGVKQTYEAMRSNVPEEISSLLNMNEINIQSQFTPFFLLNDSPGEVARTLNKYTGLEIIDKVLKVAIGNILKISNVISALQEQIKNQKVIIKSYNYVDALVILKKELQSNILSYKTTITAKTTLIILINNLTEIINKKQKLQQIIKNKNLVQKADILLQKYIQIQEKKKKLTLNCIYWKKLYIDIAYIKKKIKNKDKIKQLLILYEDQTNVISEKNEIEFFIDALKQYKLQIKKNKKITQKRTKIDTILILNTTYKELLSKIRKLKTGITLIKDIEKAFKRKQEIKLSYKQQLLKIDICPLCGGVYNAK